MTILVFLLNVRSSDLNSALCWFQFIHDPLQVVILVLNEM
ncbi:hypothetical protein BTN49_1385 [Candidatus Enterovibrio escicola]|uniref:Uncharacterized protein n=1 Tax=Candidatus Enterovibrio escicola TaxID=1927127 RepID=A0A2A5T3V5_9GAMM|nr:hypothetical protein BTN49_1385 [Candidatus Enterovibrio escacola]